MTPSATAVPPACWAVIHTSPVVIAGKFYLREQQQAAPRCRPDLGRLTSLVPLTRVERQGLTRTDGFARDRPQRASVHRSWRSCQTARSVFDYVGYPCDRQRKGGLRMYIGGGAIAVIIIILLLIWLL